jgi:hypothetical protein
MRRNLSITTAAAALLVGTVFAAAQGVQRPAPSGGAPEIGAQGQGGAQVAPQEGQGKGKAQQQPRTQGQGGNQAQGQGQATPPEGQGKGKAQSKEPRTQGQGQREQGQRETQSPRDAQPQQGQQPKQQPQQGQQTPPRDNQKGAEGKSSGAQSGGVTLNAEQRTTIRTTVLQGSNAPRVTNVNFSLNVGTVVPRTGVTLVAVPPTLIEIHPAWRGYMYFIVGEQIIIVEPASHKIVAVLVV